MYCDASCWRCCSAVQTPKRWIGLTYELLQGTKVVSQDNRHIQAASFTQARTHACVLARQLQDSQKDIQELLVEVASWQKLATEAAMHLQERDAEVWH